MFKTHKFPKAFGVHLESWVSHSLPKLWNFLRGTKLLNLPSFASLNAPLQNRVSPETQICQTLYSNDIWFNITRVELCMNAVSLIAKHLGSNWDTLGSLQMLKQSLITLKLLSWTFDLKQLIHQLYCIVLGRNLRPWPSITFCPLYEFEHHCLDHLLALVREKAPSLVFQTVWT